MVRKNLTIIQALSGKGVLLQVAAVRVIVACFSTGRISPHFASSTQGLDSTVAFAVTEVGDVWVWGEVRPDEQSPVGFYRGLKYTEAADREKGFGTDYDFSKPKIDGSGPLGKDLRPIQEQRFRPRP